MAKVQSLEEYMRKRGELPEPDPAVPEIEGAVKLDVPAEESFLKSLKAVKADPQPKKKIVSKEMVEVVGEVWHPYGNPYAKGQRGGSSGGGGGGMTEAEANQLENQHKMKFTTDEHQTAVYYIASSELATHNLKIAKESYPFGEKPTVGENGNIVTAMKKHIGTPFEIKNTGSIFSSSNMAGHYKVNEYSIQNVARLSGMIEKSKAKQDFSTFRGMEINTSVKVGSVLQAPQFLSTSPVMKTAERFVPETNGALLKINVSKGQSALFLDKETGKKYNTNEVTLQAFSMLKIVSVKEANGIKYVEADLL